MSESDPLEIQVGGRHYKGMVIQPVEFAEKNNLSFLEGCIIKRICRHRSKNKIEDLLKAKHEIDLLIHLTYGDVGHGASQSPEAPDDFLTQTGFPVKELEESPNYVRPQESA